MHPPSQILRQALVDNSVVPVSPSLAWYCWMNQLPDDGVTVDTISIYDTSGVSQGRTMGGDTLYYHGIQLLFRSLSYSVGWEKIVQTNTSIAAMNEQSVTIEPNDYSIITVNQTSDIISLGKDDDSSNSWLFSVNYQIVLKETT